MAELYDHTISHVEKKFADTFESSYSHEHMTPLNSVITNAELLLDDLQISQDQSQLLQGIANSGMMLKYYFLNKIKMIKSQKNEMELKLTVNRSM